MFGDVRSSTTEYALNNGFDGRAVAVGSGRKIEAELNELPDEKKQRLGDDYDDEKGDRRICRCAKNLLAALTVYSG